MILFHYTSTLHLGMIHEANELRLTESNVAASSSHRDALWFLDRRLTEDERDLHGLGGSYADKSAVEFTVDAPDEVAHRWVDWAPQHPAAEDWWQAIMIQTGGGLELAEHWWITTVPAPIAWWSNIRLMPWAADLTV